MDFIAAAIGNIIGIVALCLFVAGVLKLFQIATTLSEIKDLLQRRQLEHPAAPTPLASTAPSGEEMLRALDREMRMGSTEAGIDPEVVNPR